MKTIALKDINIKQLNYFKSSFKNNNSVRFPEGYLDFEKFNEILVTKFTDEYDYIYSIHVSY